MVVIWYLFRYFVILQCVRRFLGARSDDLSIPMSFAVGVVVVIGLVETLGIQPPIAIWWWFAVGSSLLMWWKIQEPSNSEAEKPKPGASPAQKIRGQSSYAARLHESQPKDS
jgi:hypothetical protein